MKEIHDAKYCHLDLKLKNILLDKYYNPIICEFGLSRPFSKGKIIFCGSFGYIPPEMFIKKAFNGYKCDIVPWYNFLWNFYWKKAFKDQKAYFQNVFVEKNKNYKDEWYQCILSNQLDKFSVISEINAIDSKKIPHLFFKIVTADVDNRASIDDVINDPWFDDINNLIMKKKKIGWRN